MAKKSLKIAFGSDLHLPERPSVRRQPALAFPAKADVLVLAGDVSGPDTTIEIATELALKHPCAQVILVAGNHEFYFHNIDQQLKSFRDSCAELDRVHFLENDTVQIEGVKFIGATLWSDFSVLGLTKESMEISARSIADFELISTRGKERFTPLDAAARFRESCKFIQGELSISEPQRTVVVTHFPPGLLTHNTMFPRDALTGYFQANVQHLIDEFQPAVWIYGHNHFSQDVLSGQTRIVSNQLGYPREEHIIPRYDPQKLILVETGTDHDVKL
ncbi:MAG: metallophosphoesterase [Pseudohongiella sp.]|nr:metallophosphoesterase [Pseudohongiella sp.]